ncbi:MAG: hypothetical protein ACOY0T_20245 [Myxococcota bacterium]
MSSPLRFRIGSKFGIIFHARLPASAEIASRGKIVDGVVTEWASVAVRSILKDHWQDKHGQWRDSIYFYELAPGDEENRIAVDEFYVEGSFAIVRHEKDPNRAIEAWKAFVAR